MSTTTNTRCPWGKGRMEEFHSSSPATPDQWAVRWIKALPGADNNVRSAFGAWSRHSASYVEAYLRQKMLDAELRGLDPHRRINAQELVARARARIHAEGKVVPWPNQVKRPFATEASAPPPTAPRPGIIPLLTVIVSIAALMVTPQLLLHRSIAQALYTTGFGQQRKIILPDGSTALLNVQSRLSVEFSPLRREVQLLQGEALFTVTHDARRPFRVHLGTTVVEDMGTTFDVRVGGAGTSVVVAEGRVVLRSDTVRHAPVSLGKNDEAFVSDTGVPRVARLSPGRVASLTAWTGRVVLLDDMSLAEAVLEFNRYNRLKLRLGANRVGELRLGGAFEFTRPLAFAASLQALGCQIRPAKDDVILISTCGASAQNAAPQN